MVDVGVAGHPVLLPWVVGSAGLGFQHQGGDILGALVGKLSGR